MANRSYSRKDRKPKRLTAKLPHLADEAFFVVGATFITAISIAFCEVIVTSLVRFCEWFSGHKLPGWLHGTLLIILCAVLIFLALFIAYMHVMGMKVPPLEEAEQEKELSLFDEDVEGE